MKLFNGEITTSAGKTHLSLLDRSLSQWSSSDQDVSTVVAAGSGVRLSVGRSTEETAETRDVLVSPGHGTRWSTERLTAASAGRPLRAARGDVSPQLSSFG